MRKRLAFSLTLGFCSFGFLHNPRIESDWKLQSLSIRGLWSLIPVEWLNDWVSESESVTEWPTQLTDSEWVTLTSDCISAWLWGLTFRIQISQQTEPRHREISSTDHWSVRCRCHCLAYFPGLSMWYSLLTKNLHRRTCRWAPVGYPYSWMLKRLILMGYKRGVCGYICKPKVVANILQ